MLLDDIDRAIAELQKYKTEGGRSMVELTTASWGRDVKTLNHISQKSGVMCPVFLLSH